MFAHGIGVDDIFIQIHETEAAEFSSGRVEYVEQCRRTMDWKHYIAEKLEDIDSVSSVRNAWPAELLNYVERWIWPQSSEEL
jgi:hypothetical protein